MATKKQPADSVTVKARVLVDGIFGKVDEVIEVSADVESPEIDKHPDAVAYAESLKG